MRAARVGSGWGVAAACLAVVGCGTKEPTRAALSGDCTGVACQIDNVPGGGSSTGDAGGDAADATAADDASADAATSVTVTGSLARTSDSGFLQSTAFSGALAVWAQGPGGIDVQGAASDGSFTLDGVAPGKGNWFAAIDATVGGGTVLSTIEPLDVDAAQPVVKLLAVDRVELQQVLFGLSLPQQPATGTGYAMLFFQKAGVGSPGVTVTAPSGATVLYDSGAGYDLVANGVTKTGDRGMAIVVGIAAPAYPGSTLSVVYDAGAGARSAAVRVAAGAVTRLFVDL